MAHLLVIALGPIQDFIASARRCQDLWYGSFLLSELARATAGAVPGGGLVFPDERSAHAREGRGAEVANKVVAVVEGDASAVRDVAARARKAMESRRDALVAKVFGRLPGAGFHRAEAEAQVRDLLEFVWVAVPIDAGEGGYRKARQHAERLLAARKNTRRWRQPTAWSRAGVPKSSLDGLRESVVDESLYPREGQRDTPALARARRALGVEGMERLCGVGVLKRMGRRDYDTDEEGRRRRFASTSHLAALPWMIGIDREATHTGPRWSAYCAALDAISEDILRAADVVNDVHAEMFGRVDGQLFFEGRLLETLEECGLTQDSQRKAALRALRAFLKGCKRHEPQGYYAILHADGDRMGRVIDHHDRAAHVALSAALVGFAGRVLSVVAEHQGSLVYSGGDDVLALLPLHRAVDCAEALAAEFAKAMGRFVDGQGRPSTLSAGLAVVHHLTPFDVALDLARRAEKDAKAAGGDALTVLVDKRGGAEQRVSGRWDELVPALRRLVTLHQTGAVSAKTGHDLAALARLTDGADDADLATLGCVARATARQLFDAKRAKGGQQPLAAAVIDELLAALPAEAPATTGDPAGDRAARRRFAEAVRALGDRIVLAQQLARVDDELAPRMQNHTAEEGVAS